MNVHTKRNGMWFVRKNVSYDIQNKCASRSRCAFRRIQTAKKRSLHKSTPIRKTSFRFSGVVHRWKKKYRETSVARWNTAKIYRLLFCSPWGWQLACDLRGKKSERKQGRKRRREREKNPGYNGTKPLWIFKTHRPARGTLLSTICCIVCKSFFL